MLTNRRQNRMPATNSRFAKAGVSCFYDSEVLNSSFVHLMKFSAENPRLRKAAKRCLQFYKKIVSKMRFSIIFTLVFILSSFLPIIQIVFLNINGGIFSFLENNTNFDGTNISLIFNFLFSVIFAIFYFRCKSLLCQIINSILIAFFFTSFVSFSKIQLFGNEEGNFYFLPFLISAIIIGITIISIEKIKYSKQKLSLRK